MTVRLVFGGFFGRLLRLVRLEWVGCLLFFVLGLVLRGVPELLVPVYPVGYETVTYYAPAIVSFAGKGVLDVFFGFFRAGPLFYVLMWLASVFSGADVFLLLKVAGPVLYGGLLVSFFVFLRRGLRFEWRMAFVATFLLGFQIAALRDSWDRFRTVLGLVFLFAGLTALRSSGTRGLKWGLLSVFGLLTVLSRDYVGVLLFASVVGFVVLEKNLVNGVRSLVALLPGFVVYAVMVFPWFSDYWGGVAAAEFASRSYVWVVQDAFAVFVVCYLLLLPFVVLGLRGRRRDWLVGSMLVWLLIASFSVVGGPVFSVPGYQRWLILLVFPFCVYGVWGFERLGLFSKRRLWMLAAVMLVYVVVGSGYASGVVSYGWWLSNSYVVGDLVQSSIPWDRVDDVKAVLAWLDVYAVSGSVVLVEESLYGWTQLYLSRVGEDVGVMTFSVVSWSRSVLDAAVSVGSGVVYLVSFGLDVEGFSVVYSWNGVLVSEYSVAGVQ